MRTLLYLDAETLPSHDPAIREQIAGEIKPPGSMKKAETIAAWEAEEKPTAIEKAVKATSLDGTLGHLACICWSVENGKISGEASVIAADGGCRIPATHEEMLAAERQALDAALRGMEREVKAAGIGAPVIVGHNVTGFDIRLIMQRAIILGVRLPIWWPLDPKPWSDAVFDTMVAWSGRDFISQDKLARALGLVGKQGLDGSKVAEVWAAGGWQDVLNYCGDDVDQVRAIYGRMRLSLAQQAA